MAEYDKGRFYWIKLTDRFMTSDTVDFLMSQKDGANYVVLYQMLCLKTVNNDGVLARSIGEMIIPYDVEKIQRDCKWFTVDTVRVALELYKKLGLIYEHSNGVLAITDFDRLIGSQSEGALKKQEQRRARLATISTSFSQSGQKVDICPPEKDKEKDIEIDIDNNCPKTDKIRPQITAIFEHWNSKNIIKHREITPQIAKAINKALASYDEDTICMLIDRYAQVIADETFFFDYKWTLKDFLSRKDGISSFTDEGSKWASYQQHISKPKGKSQPRLQEQSFEDRKSVV